MKIWNRPTAGNTSTNPGGASSLNDLADVAIANPQAGQIIKYDGSTFINGEVPGLIDIQAQFNNLNADNLTSGIIPYPRLPNLSEITLSGDGVPPYISSITPITPNGSQEIEILGEYFSPITQLNIPGVAVNNLEVRSPSKIIANISKTGLSGSKIVTLSNGANSNQLWAEGIKSISILADPYFANVLLFLKGNGENNSTNIIDSSPQPKSITRFGDTKISSAQSKYGGSSIYFDGANDYLLVPEFNLSNDFTIEAWINPSILNATKTIFHINSGSNNGLHIYANGAYLAVDNGLVADYLQPFFTATNSWYHVALTRVGSILSFFGNGTLLNSRTQQVYGSPTQLLIGRFGIGGVTGDFSGYLSHIRYTNMARYTINFNPESDTYLNI